LHPPSQVWPEPAQPKSLFLGRISRKGHFAGMRLGLM
jgi:hypothetical protein